MLLLMTAACGRPDVWEPEELCRRLAEDPAAPCDAQDTGCIDVTCGGGSDPPADECGAARNEAPDLHVSPEVLQLWRDHSPDDCWFGVKQCDDYFVVVGCYVKPRY